MKKIAIILLTFASALRLSAGEVDYSRAVSAARAFFNSGPGTGSKLPSIVRMSAAATGRKNVYVFNNEAGGFVVIAGDDRVNPVLAYSRTSTITATNPSFEWWLDSMESQIESLPDDIPSIADWGDRMSVGTPVCQYETAKWNQYEPYNDFCPIIGKNKAATGCVATGTAIVLRYFKWPNKGYGTVPAYKYYSDELNTVVQIGENVLEKEYDWDMMPLKLGRTYTEDEASQIARLMYDLGTAAEMQYGYMSGSGAYTYNMLQALKKYFAYSSKMTYVRSSDYSATKWRDILELNILNYGPTVYAGFDSRHNMGHYFVIDGFTEDHYLSINWGWGGADDGYFKVDAVIVDGYDFSKDAESIFGMKPDYNVAVDIAANTSASFDVAGKILSLKCDAEGVKCTVADDAGTVLSDMGMKRNAELSFDMKDFKPGLYSVTLSNGFDTCTFNIVL